MEPIELVDDVIQTLKKGWCKGNSAQDKSGNPVSMTSKEASCFCLTGAVHKKLFSDINYTTIQTVNDFYANMKPLIESKYKSRIFDISFTGSSACIRFNDHPDTTLDEIIDLLEEFKLNTAQLNTAETSEGNTK